MSRRVVGLGSAILVSVWAAAAEAQLYGPTPTLMGQPSFHLWTVPGVMDIGVLDTFFPCANVTAAPIRVGVEVFGPPGGGAANDPSVSSLEILPGGTALFGTSFAVGLSVDSSLAPGLLSKGAARILATKSRGIVCSAFLAAPGSAPPVSMVSLSVIKKTKQAGD